LGGNPCRDETVGIGNLGDQDWWLKCQTAQPKEGREGENGTGGRGSILKSLSGNYLKVDERGLRILKREG